VTRFCIAIAAWLFMTPAPRPAPRRRKALLEFEVWP
jgi:hypothetical protein